MEHELIRAARKGHEKTVRMLLDPQKYGYIMKKADIHFCDDIALHTAIQNRHMKIAYFLIENGADIHDCDWMGLYVLFDHAVVDKQYKLVDLLLENGYNQQINKSSALSAAVRNGDTTMVHKLLENGYKIQSSLDEALITAAREGDVTMCHLMLEHGADVHFDDEMPLIMAAQSTADEVIPVLLKYGADVGVADKNSSGGIIFDAWGNQCSEATINLLWGLPSGSKAHIQTAVTDPEFLATAASDGDDKMVHLLLENGADFRAQENSALQEAIGNGHTKIVDMFLNPRKYGLEIEGYDWDIFSSEYSPMSKQIKELDHQELYENVRVIYYSFKFSKQCDYSTGCCGALIQALSMSL